jgi:arsenate reductase
MAEAFLKSLDSSLDVVSAGTHPSNEVHPKAIQVMQELGIDISSNRPQSVDLFTQQSFDFLITVCGGAKETCPVFSGHVKKRLHIGFDDPAEVEGEASFILSEFRRIRDEIKKEFELFLLEIEKS